MSAAGQHAPANLGYFSLSILDGGPSISTALVWNLIPAGIGNVIGGTVLVALPLWYLYGHDRRQGPDQAFVTQRAQPFDSSCLVTHKPPMSDDA